jgi:hypothetical protein
MGGSMNDNRTDKERIDDLEKRVSLLESALDKLLESLRTVAGIYRKVTRSNKGDEDKSE